MTAFGILSPIATIAGVGMALSPALQVRRMVRRRAAADVSLAAQGVIASGSAALLGYAVALGAAPLIAIDATGTVASSACFAVGLRLRRPTGRVMQGAPLSPAASAAEAEAE